MKEPASKKRKIATALKYNHESSTKDNPADIPRLIAKGNDEMARKIIEEAKKSGVDIYEDERLARQLNRLELGDYIPIELYQAVAEVLAFIVKIDQSIEKKKWGFYET